MLESVKKLREWISSLYTPNSAELKSEGLSIADRIDEDYQKAIRELNSLSDASVLLPVDDDGVPIRVGDVVEEFDMRTVGKARGEVIRIVFGKYATDVRIDTGTGYADRNPANVRHVDKKPTVEDLLREFGRGWHEQMNEPETFDVADYVERYAAKLRLADYGEEQQ